MSFLTVIFIAVTSVALGYLARVIARLRGLSGAEQRKTFWGFTFAGPWIVGFIIFVLGPTFTSLYYSFTNYKLGSQINWIGLDNYRQMLLVQGAPGRQFNQSMYNSFYYAIIGVPLQIVAALAMAMMLNNEIRGVRIFRTIFYLPVILAGGPALLLAWRYMLTSNGGFINVALQRFADSFIGFEYIYRLLIYLSESFNGFFTGLVRGDPVGPLKYTLPAFIAVLVLALLAKGEWTEGKRVMAWRVAQVFGIITFYSLAAKGLMMEPINAAWLYVGGVTALLGILASAQQGRKDSLRLWQFGGLGLLGISLFLVLEWAGFDLSTPHAKEYGLAIALSAVAVAASFVGRWSRPKYLLLGAAAVVLSVIIVIKVAPGQLDGGRLNVITHYLTFGSTIKHTDDLKYLNDGYPVETMSQFWIYGLVIASLLGAALLHETYPRARRVVLLGSLAFFALFTVGSFLDTRTYFQAFVDLAKAAGKPNYHFALFHQAFDQFPDSTRVPLWMSSELWSKPSLILITMWSSGTGMLIFLAALKGVPGTFYEAAEVDGANSVQKFFKITLPLISPALFYNIVIGVIGALQTFDSVFILQTPTTQASLSSAAFQLFQRTFRQLAVGEGAAMSWILVIIILTLTILQFRYSRSWVYYEA
jgi:ABC-type sugar transport system permease subunit